MGNTSVAESEDETAPSGSAEVKRAHTVNGVVQTSGLSRSMVYLAIGSGALPAKKCGARTLILDEDLLAFLRNLPPFVKKTPSEARRLQRPTPDSLTAAPERPSRRARFRKRVIAGRERAA